ncbi:MAG: decaprenyl-phosphate phosphoribosyltransferase [Anaerolineales bacterium]|nr:decaprenyl-phosphate phosphoribosyltransferase [Anaerolineales bacterium]
MAWIKDLIKSLRPKQWPKNVFLFAALVFDRQFFLPEPLLRTAAGFLLLCLASGSVYLINDIADRNQDRLHPSKRKRPIASGRLSVPTAAASAAVLMAATLAAAHVLAPPFAVLAAVYILLNFAYSFWLKHVPVVDALMVAFFFVLRVVGGVLLITVERFSPWMYVCMTLLALFISFGKRRSEILLLEEGASNHRRVLRGYSIPLLDSYIQIVSAATIVAYSFYTFEAPNLPENHAMMLTIPFVVYGLFRYLYLVQIEHIGGAPEELVLTDRPLQAAILLWGLAAMMILYLWT